MGQVLTGTKWHPAESAPKDGRWILAKYCGGYVAVQWVVHSFVCLADETWVIDEWTEIPLANENKEAQRLVNRILERAPTSQKINGHSSALE